jgi:hypothetical protein
MTRRSLRPNLNQIRAWVRQGRTDAWVAHQLDVSVRDIEQFKRQNDLVSDEEALERAAGEFDEEIDLRAEDDALIAAELEAAEIEAEREKERLEAEEREAEEREARERAETGAGSPEVGDEDSDDEEDGRGGRLRRRRGGRGRRSRARNTGPLEGTFDHGEEGYGLWLDPAIVDNPIYAEHWAGHRPVEVTVEEDQIVIRRSGQDD